MANEKISNIGVSVSYKAGGASDYTLLPNIYELPDLSNGERETLEVTTLQDTERKYIGGLYAGSEGLEFKAYYVKEEFTALNAITDTCSWEIEFPDGLTCTFDGTCSVKLDGASFGSVISYTLTVIPTSKLTFA